MNCRHFRVTTSIITVPVGALIIGFSSCSVIAPTDDGSHTRHSATLPFSYGYAVDDHGRLEILAGNNSVEIVGVTEQGTVLIWGERRVRSESVEDAEAHLDDIEIHIDRTYHHVRLETIQPESSDGRIYEVDYRARVPRDWGVTIDKASGAVSVSLLNGPICIDLANGDAHLDRVLGDVYATLFNGDILADLSLVSGGTCDIVVTNGDIDLGIPHTTSAMFSAHIVNGSIDVSELPLNETGHSSNEVHGYLGGGDGSINLEATNGSIRVCCSR